MFKMAFAALLVTSLLLTLLVAESSQQLTILHSYPEPGNFSYVELVCVANDSQSSSVVTEARFQLNGTDIGENDEIVVTLGKGYLWLLLTQEKDGFVTCSSEDFVSNNSIGLAGKIGVDLLCSIAPLTTLCSPQLNQEQLTPPS